MLDNCSGGLGSKETAESSEDSVEYLGTVVNQISTPYSPEDSPVCLRCNPSDQNQLLDRVHCLCSVPYQHDYRYQNDRSRSTEPRDLMRLDNPGITPVIKMQYPLFLSHKISLFSTTVQLHKQVSQVDKSVESPKL